MMCTNDDKQSLRIIDLSEFHQHKPNGKPYAVLEPQTRQEYERMEAALCSDKEQQAFIIEACERIGPQGTARKVNSNQIINCGGEARVIGRTPTGELVIFAPWCCLYFGQSQGGWDAYLCNQEDPAALQTLQVDIQVAFHQTITEVNSKIDRKKKPARHVEFNPLIAELANELGLGERLTWLSEPPCVFVHATSLEEARTWISFMGFSQHFNAIEQEVRAKAGANNSPFWEWANVHMGRPPHVTDSWVLIAAGAFGSISSGCIYTTLAIAKKGIEEAAGDYFLARLKTLLAEDTELWKASHDRSDLQLDSCQEPTTYRNFDPPKP